MPDIDPIDHLSAIDGVEHPDPGFAAGLLDTLLEELADTRDSAPVHLVDDRDHVEVIVPTPAVDRLRRRGPSWLLVAAAVLVVIVGGGVLALRDRSPDADTVFTDDAHPDAPAQEQSLVDVLGDDGGFTYLVALLQQSTPDQAVGDCALGGEYTIYAQTDASIDAFLADNDLEAAVLFADAGVVSALLDDIVLEGAIPPPPAVTSGSGRSVAGEPIGVACNGIAYEVGGFWTPSDAARVMLLDLGPELAAAEAVADAFMQARSDWDGAALRSIVADDALIRGELGPAEPDSYVARSSIERAMGARPVDFECVASTTQLVRCTYALESDIGSTLRGEPYAENLMILTIQGGEIQQVLNSIGNSALFIEDGEQFRAWLEETHPDDLTMMMIGDGPLLSEAALLSDQAIALWELRLREYLEAVGG